MEECYHNFCDAAALNDTVPFADLGFISKTTQAIIDSVVEAADCQCRRSTQEVDRSGQFVDGLYNFVDKRRNVTLDDIPINDRGEPIISKIVNRQGVLQTKPVFHGPIAPTPPNIFHTAFDPGFIQTLNPGTIQTLNPGPIETLNPGPIQTLNPGPFPASNPGSIQAFNPGAIQSLEPQSIQTLNPVPIQTLIPGQIQGFNPGTIQSFDPRPIQSFNPGQIQGFNPGSIQTISQGSTQAYPEILFPAPTDDTLDTNKLTRNLFPGSFTNPNLLLPLPTTFPGLASLQIPNNLIPYQQNLIPLIQPNFGFNSEIFPGNQLSTNSIQGIELSLLQRNILLAGYAEKLRLTRALELLNLEQILLYRTVADKEIENAIYSQAFKSNIPGLNILNNFQALHSSVSPFPSNTLDIHPLALELLIRNNLGSVLTLLPTSEWA